MTDKQSTLDDALSSLFYTFLFDFSTPSTQVSNGASGNVMRTVNIKDLFGGDIGLYILQYNVRWDLITVPNNLIIGMAFTKGVLTSDLWTTTAYETRQDRMIHFDSSSSNFELPISDKLYIRKPIIFKYGDQLSVGIFIDNNTGSTFNKIVKMHTIFLYKMIR